MTDIALAQRQPDRIARLVARLRRWLAEEVVVESPVQQFTPRDWADLPTYHTIRDDGDAR